MARKHAFLCKCCGCKEPAEAAGEYPRPRSCSVCGKAEWEVLALATAARLIELGLTADDVCAHTPLDHGESRRQDAERARAEHATLCAAEADWEANQNAYLARWQELDVRAAALQARVDQLSPGKLGSFGTAAQAQEWAEKSHELTCVRQEMKALENKEPCERHHALKAKIEAGLAEHETYFKHRAAEKPKSFFAGVIEKLTGSSHP